MNFLNAEPNQSPISFERSSGKVLLNTDRVRTHLASLIPLTFPFRDRESRTIQVFDTAKGLLGGVVDINGKFQCIAGNRIGVPLNPQATSRQIVEALQSIPLKRWDLVFDAKAKKITIWPHLEAAGENSMTNRLKSVDCAGG